MFELDHVFVCCAGEGDADEVSATGVQRGGGVVHHGQGTANALFHFDNAYLELVWMHDEAELHADSVRPLGLWQRLHWRETGASPFGLCLRGPHQPATWHYQPAYLPPGCAIPIVTPPGAFGEPLVFLSLVSGPRSVWPRPPLEHLGERRRMERVTIESPACPVVCAWVNTVLADAPVEVRSGEQQQLTVHLSGSRGVTLDFDPLLPFRILL